MTGYSSAQFWDKRYEQRDIAFDWYVEYPELRYSLQNLYPFEKDSNILMIGCGNSNLSEQLFDQGYINITNIDISPVVIDQMSQQMQAKNKSMKWLVMDATNTDFKDEEFDVVMDKGTLDALICGTDLSLTDALLLQMGRVMKKTGQMIIITHSGPEGRKRVFESGLSFDKYDYFFNKIYLSSSNILINLMKANKTKMKDSTEKQVLTRTMLEFSLVEMKKKKTKPERLQILWSQFNVKKLSEGEGNPQLIEVEKQIQEPKEQEPTIPSPKKQDPSIDYNSDQKNQASNSEQTSTKEKQIPSNRKIVFKKVGQLNPKQPYCFIYSITLKPYLDLQQTLNLPELNAPIDQSLISNLTLCQTSLIINDHLQNHIIIETDNVNPALAAIKYLQTLKFKLPKIVINPHESMNQLSKQDNLLSFKYSLNNTPHRSTMLISMRSQLNFQLTVQNSNPIGLGNQELQLTQTILAESINLTENNLKYNITPNQYSKMQDLSKNGKESVHSLIKNVWSPEIIISSFEFSPTDIIIKGKLCLPPPASQQDYLSLETTFPGFKIVSFNRGYFYSDPSNKLLASVSPICRSHAEITVEKLWLSYYESQFGFRYSEMDGVLKLSERVAVYVIVNLLKVFGYQE